MSARGGAITPTMEHWIGVISDRGHVLAMSMPDVTKGALLNRGLVRREAAPHEHRLILTAEGIDLASRLRRRFSPVAVVAGGR